MYHPAARADGKNLEFVEIYNSDGIPRSLGGFRIDGDVSYVFPEGTVIGAQSFVVVAGAPADLQSVYGITGALGPFADGKNLSNNGGKIELWSKAGALLLEVHYSDNPPWPAAADGAGHSLVLARPTYGQDNVLAWAASARVGGSPGGAEPAVNDAYVPLMINEILAHTDEPVEDYIELYNHSNAAIDLTGCILTDDPDTNKFVIGSLSIPARGFVSFTQSQLGFALSADGETVYLKNPAATRVIDAIRFGGQENGVSFGRFPDGGPEWYRLSALTPGAANAAILQSPVVINELMYAPITHDADDQFVELYNWSGADVNLSGWKLSDGIDYTIPTNTVLKAGNYLVIAKNAARMLANYTNLTSANTLGDFSGKLAGSGERVALTKPDSITVTNVGAAQTITIHIAVDEVTYGTGGRWTEWADAGGSSLELVDPRSNHRLATSWADSDETKKAPWTLVEHTGVLDNGSGTADQLQMILQGAGEALVDDIKVLGSAGTNMIANGTFENGTTGWTAEGTQDLSGIETTEAFEGTKSYHIRAVDRGDTGANRIRTPLTPALTVGSTATIHAQMRWLRGHPEALLRFRGNYLEAIGTLTVPKNLGTPGAPNSRAKTNDAPGIYAVSHAPVLPAAGQSFVVTARVEDVDAPNTVQLIYRFDQSGGSVTNAMNDLGTGGDAVAGDGIYSATVPGAPVGINAAFYIRAVDKFGAERRFPSDGPTRECLVRYGETQLAGPIGTYRLWMTAATLSKWTSRSPLNNTALDVTFVYNNERVIYNMRALYAGSPYIAPGYNGPTGGLCGYTGEFPKDDLFLGNNDFVLDWPGRDNAAVSEQMGYFIADGMGLPNSHRRFIHLHVNGTTDQSRGSVYEDVQQPGGDMVNEWSAQDTGGHFYKIERWFEFSDTIGLSSDLQPRLQNYTTTGGAKKLARYRWNFLPRAVEKTANDFDDVFAWVDAVNATAPEPYTSQTESLCNMEEIMGMFAVERIINNFDSWGHEIGKNMYGYKPENGRWMTFIFDLDWLMIPAAGHNSYSPTSPLFTPCEDPTVARMYAHPPFRRAYFRNIKKAVDVMTATNMNPVMDAKYNMLVASGVTRSAGQTLVAPTAVKTWISQRRDFLITQLNTLTTTFAITSNGGANFESPSSVVALVGTAPIDAAGIAVNGVKYPVTWTGDTQWSMQVPLSAASTVLNLQGLAPDDSFIAGMTNSITVTYAGSIESPVGHVVFNEIMYHPPVSNGAFIELRSLSTNTTYDLSNWRIEGAGFTFPAGSILAPGGFTVVAKDRVVFAATYGNSIPLAGEFSGQLQNSGETLWLIKPGVTASLDTIIDQVTYSDAPPWPSAADGLGGSLQLIDATQDNNRVLNWGAVLPQPTTNQPKSLITITGSWKYDQSGTDLGTAWIATNYNDTAWPSGGGLLFVETAALPAPKTTPLQLGKTTYYFRSHFNYIGDASKIALNLSTVVDDGLIIYLNGHEIYRVAMTDPVNYATFATRVVGDAVYEGPYALPSTWLQQGDNVVAVEVHQANSGSSDIVFGMTLDTLPLAPPVATPGASNSIARALPTFPTVWINEIEPSNISGIVDDFGLHSPWVELYNSGAGAVSLAGWYLSDSTTNLSKWPFPAGASIAAGQRILVWLDGRGSGMHANFHASAQIGTIALIGPYNNAQTVIDYLNYSGVPNDRSMGRYPDASGAFELFFNATPGSANDDAAPALPLFINEWMASNSAIPDPTDGHYDDWFEIYNPNNVAVDLTGYSLTDNLADPLGRYVIPNGWSIAPGQFMLVWADGDSPTNAAQLHVPFKLDRTGENIALFAPNGSLVDSITFGLQTNNISQGRYPNGAATFEYFTAATPGAPNVKGDPNLRITGLNVDAAGNVVLNWIARPGATYHIEYKGDLNQNAWTELGQVTPNSSTGQYTTTISADGRRYYRIGQF